MKTSELNGRLPRLIAAAGLPVCLALSLLLSAAGAANAQSAGHRAEAEQACTPDVMQHCSEVIPDERKIVACLKQKRRLISVACRTVLTPQQVSASHRKKRSRRRH